MQRTLKLKLRVEPTDSDILIRTIEQFNRATTYCARWCYKNHTRSKRRVHDATYYDVRDKYGLPASLTTSARDVGDRVDALRGLCP